MIKFCCLFCVCFIVSGGVSANEDYLFYFVCFYICGGFVKYALDGECNGHQPVCICVFDGL